MKANVKLAAGVIVILLLVLTIYFAYLGTMDFFSRRATRTQNFGISIVSLILLVIAVKVRDRL